MATQEALSELIHAQREGILATIAVDACPQLSNILYVADPSDHLVPISTTADRMKSRNLARDSRAALHVGGGDFWKFVVGEGTATLSEGRDAAIDELRTVHSASYGDVGEREAFAAELIAHRRLVIRLQIGHLYGVMATGARRPNPKE
jgi:PPOX class probable F420-dependent enzyme